MVRHCRQLHKEWPGVTSLPSQNSETCPPPPPPPPLPLLLQELPQPSQEEDMKFQHPFTMMITGPTGVFCYTFFP